MKNLLCNYSLYYHKAPVKVYLGFKLDSHMELVDSFSVYDVNIKFNKVDLYLIRDSTFIIPQWSYKRQFVWDGNNPTIMYRKSPELERQRIESYITLVYIDAVLGLYESVKAPRIVDSVIVVVELPDARVICRANLHEKIEEGRYDLEKITYFEPKILYYSIDDFYGLQEYFELLKVTSRHSFPVYIRQWEPTLSLLREIRYHLDPNVDEITNSRRYSKRLAAFLTDKMQGSVILNLNQYVEPI